MARKDCTEFALTINDLATDLSVLNPALDLDGVVAEINAGIGFELTRDTVRDSIIDVNAQGPRVSTEEAKAIAAMRKEARTDKRLTKFLKDYDDAIARGGKPSSPRRAKAIESDRIRALRSMLAHKKRTTVGLRSNQREVDRLQERIKELTEEGETGKKAVKAKPKPREVSEEVAQLRKLREKLKRIVSRSDPVLVERVRKEIAALKAVIEEGDFTPKLKAKPTLKSKRLRGAEFERDELRRTIRREINGLKPKSLFAKIYNGTGLSRAMMTGFEASMVLRQGGQAVAAGRFREVGEAMKKSLAGAYSKQRAFELEAEFKDRALAPEYRRARLGISDIDGPLSKGEEEIQTSLLKFIPGLSASSRAYLIFLNSLRMDLFDLGYQTLGKTETMNDAEMKQLANGINISSGRGNIGPLDRVAPQLNFVMFAPRFVASRFQMVLGSPFLLGKEITHQVARAAGKPSFVGGSSRVRKLLIKEVARSFVGQAMFYSMAYLFFGDDDEFDIEWNPRSSDFGKLRFGNTRIDPLRGLSQVVVFLSRFATGESKNPVTQNITSIEDPNFFKQLDLDLVGTNFFKSKLSPVSGLIRTLATRKPFDRDETPLETAGGYVLPMTGFDIADAIQEQGVTKSTAMGIAAFFGAGLQTFGEAFELKTIQQLEAELEANLYKDVKANRDLGRVGKVRKGEQGRVEAIRAELRSRK